MERVFQLPPTTYIGGPERSLPLREIIQRLEVCSVLPCILKKEMFYVLVQSLCFRVPWVYFAIFPVAVWPSKVILPNSKLQLCTLRAYVDLWIDRLMSYG